MNWPQATFLAESKPYQLFIAHQIGFKVPYTLIGNDVEYFKRHFANQLVAKSLDTVLFRNGEESLFTYSSRCDIADITDEAVFSAPLIVQNYYERKVDCRITIIGELVFAVKIQRNGTSIIGDWRLTPKEELEYIDFVLPENIEVACKNLMKELNLSFGAIDLLEIDNEYIFLEINPTGEWGWLNSQQRPFDLEIAKWLAEIH